MRGAVRVRISSARVKYDFTLERGITIIRGDSATGKSELIRQISDYEMLGKESGIVLDCKAKCTAVWRDLESAVRYIANAHGEVLFFDEVHKFVKTKEFARAVKFCDNYIVIITREDLRSIPYSVKAVKKISSSQVDECYWSILEDYFKSKPRSVPFQVEQVITEDSNSGCEMYAKVFQCKSIPGGGNANICNMIKHVGKTVNCLIVVDGAAFGAYYSEVTEFLENNDYSKVLLWLPESFEYLILKSGIVGKVDEQLLNETYDYADTTEFETWEQFYTHLLIELTKYSDEMRYTKTSLAYGYTKKSSIQQFLSVVPSVLRKSED